MGQKTHPYGLRVGYIKPWKSRWFARKEYVKNLAEDLEIRDHIKEKWGFAGIASLEIERSGKRMRVTIHTARPGIIIGRRGAEIDRLRDEMGQFTANEIMIDIKEIKLPQVEAQLVAENIAQQLEKRVSFRKAMKKAVQLAMMKGAQGIKMQCGGRLGGSEIARTEGYKDGKVPLSTFRADVDYGFAEAFTTYGTIGCKVWIYKGEVLVKKEEAAKAKERKERENILDRDAAPRAHAPAEGEPRPETPAEPQPEAPAPVEEVQPDKVPEQGSKPVSAEEHGPEAAE
jgi:small subunit ribosomal protein S3